jgi:hypothetical protein
MVKGLCPRSGDWVDLAVSLDLSKARRVLQDQKPYASFRLQRWWLMLFFYREMHFLQYSVEHGA